MAASREWVSATTTLTGVRFSEFDRLKSALRCVQMARSDDLIEAFGALRGTLRDVVQRRGDPLWKETLLQTLHTLPRAAVSTLPWLVKAREGHDESWVRVVEDNAVRARDQLAIEMGDEQLTWGELDAKV